jgi:hypothetical protein
MALTFTDVPVGHWAYNAVDWVSNNGYMNGTGGGLFSPGTDMTRAEIVTILYAIAGKPGSGGGTQYSDVSGSAYYAAPALWAKNKGLGIQNSSTVFAPSTYLERVKIAEALWKFAQVINWTTSAVPNITLPYTDISGLTTAQVNALKWCRHYSIMNGTSDTTFGPTVLVYRAQMAVMVKALADRASGFYPVNSVSVRKGMCALCK